MNRNKDNIQECGWSLSTGMKGSWRVGEKERCLPRASTMT